MDMSLRLESIQAFDAVPLPYRSAVAVETVEAVNDRSIPADDSGFDSIHFFADDPDNLQILALREYGCKVTTHSLDTDVSVLSDATRAAIVMDVPHLSRSFTFFRHIRSRGIEFPLVVLSQVADPFDEVLALELGADEVIGRQVHPRVLLAQLQAISRRASRARTETQVSMLRFGGLQVDGTNREVSLAGQRISLTAGEFDLLWLLAQHAGRVIHRDDVLRRLRGLSGSHGNRSIDSRLYRLRHRFTGIPDIATRIKSVRPYGYMFANSPW